MRILVIEPEKRPEEKPTVLCRLFRNDMPVYIPAVEEIAQWRQSPLQRI